MYAAKEQASPDAPEIKEHRVSKGGAFLVFLVPVIFLGLRSQACDTGGYIGHFSRLPPNDIYSTFSQFSRDYTKGKGFYFFSYLIKRFISRDFHIWFLILCVIFTYCIVRLFRKYSPDFRLTVYLYFASCCYSWFMNGIRQYLAVVICMVFIELALKNKVWYDVLYVGVALLMATVHSSAYIMIPIYFLAARQKALTKKTNIILVISVIVIIALVISGVYERFVREETEYSNDLDYFKGNAGTGFYRVALNCIPAILVIIKYKDVKEKMTPFIGILINMSFMTAGLYVFSMFRTGMLEGRLPAYTEAFDFILYPWLIKYIYKDSSIIRYGLIVVYLAFFFFQMKLTWDGLGYESDVLTFLN